MPLRNAASPRPFSNPDTPAASGTDGRFRNPISKPRTGFREGVRLMWAFLNKPANTVPDQPVPTHALTRDALLGAPDRTLFRLGHSTVLLKLRGVFWLTDPVFSERASPVQWLGPKRFHPPPIALADLPDIEAVILSHDHYDHLDRETVLALAPKVKHFLTPLGVGDRLIDWGIAADKVRQLNWWQSAMVGGLQLTATPAQHFSGRTPFDGNRTLWASWVLIDDDLRIFFSGDTGYFPGFKAIGDRFGPFDLTLMETGAYDPRWSYVHMLPEQTVQAHLDLRGRRLLPIHNGTFDLALHAWQEPFERVAAAARARAVEVLTPAIGMPFDMVHPGPTPAWWRPHLETSQLAAAPSPAA
ncbi:hydrolase (plasmid) [Ralstonia solanacearum]|nr:hydrolase [Ralstonia solanacearum]